MPKGGIRFLFWVVVLLLVVGAKLGFELMAPAPPAPPVVPEFREATTAEWQLPIAELGAQSLAKGLVLRPYSGSMPVPGKLVWWHGDDGEGIAYLPLPGEDPQRSFLVMLAGIEDGSIILYEMHGDADLRHRMLGDLGTRPVFRLPDGWTVLSAPVLPAQGEN